MRDDLIQIRRPAARDASAPAPREPGLSRRELLQIAGGGAALLATGCSRQPPNKILPYSDQPPEIHPGIPLHFATSMVMDGYAIGLVVETHEGRPTKIEGNPEHPASLGAAGVFQQAAVRQLYDAQRARNLRHGTEPSYWDQLFARLVRDRSDHGAGLRLLMEPTSSPLHAELLDRVHRLFPEARFTFFSPLGESNRLQGARLAYGRALLPRLDPRHAEVLLLVDDDLLGGGGPFALRYARQLAARRDPDGGDMSRLYVVEQEVTATGSIADHRMAVRRGDAGALLCAVAAELSGLDAPVRAAAARWRGRFGTWPAAVARDLARRPAGHTLVAAGEGQPAEVHALVHAMNAALGNLGHTVLLQEPALIAPPGTEDLAALAAELHAGQIDTIVVLGGNPAYGAPADLELAAGLRRASDSIYLGLYEDETAACCRWFAPETHFLEEWGDARAYDGTLSLVQPVLQPLFSGRSTAELLAAIAGDRSPSGFRLLRSAWARRAGASEPVLDEAPAPVDAAADATPIRQPPPEDQPAWQQALQRGFVDGSAAAAVTAAPDPGRVAAAVGRIAPSTGNGRLELSFAPSPVLFDGRFANNPWLLEQATPITKLTWDNAVLLSPATARRLGVATQDVVELRAGGKHVAGPVLAVPGHADDALTVWIGYGRSGSEANARGVGFDVTPLRTRAALHAVPVEVKKTGRRHRFALNQLELSTHGRPIALRTTLRDYRDHTTQTEHLKGRDPRTLFEGPRLDAPMQWAMTIDLGLCIGCGACVTACRAENNWPVVGRDQASNHRTMDWLRIDTYFDEHAAGRPVNQPMLCQHCEHAPCEYVCPVNATVHSSDGLNEMVYNRCVGTRFCSNNCPYKVRRFNWFKWQERVPMNRGLAELQYNPDVTVRERGVMEKCTYCVQRIRRTEIDARNQGREIRPGEVVTACQQACPTQAISFGSLSHRDTEMVRRRELPRSFEVLHELGTRPRTMYLARIDNPNPELG